jgi:hypothetical protein
MVGMRLAFDPAFFYWAVGIAVLLGIGRLLLGWATRL